jgi:hypothetical protein
MLKRILHYVSCAFSTKIFKSGLINIAVHLLVSPCITGREPLSTCSRKLMFGSYKNVCRYIHNFKSYENNGHFTWGLQTFLLVWSDWMVNPQSLFLKIWLTCIVFIEMCFVPIDTIHVLSTDLWEVFSNTSTKRREAIPRRFGSQTWLFLDGIVFHLSQRKNFSISGEKQHSDVLIVILTSSLLKSLS